LQGTGGKVRKKWTRKACKYLLSDFPRTLPGTMEKLAGIPVIEPLYRKDGMPVFAVEEA
jgi:hypothetical protein